MNEPQAVQRSYGASHLYVIASFVVIVAGLRMAQQIVQPFLLAVFVSIISVPAYAWLVQRKVASWLALLMVISAVVGMMLIVLFIVMTSLADFTSNQDHYAEQLRVRTLAWRQKLDSLFAEPEPKASPGEGSNGDQASDTETADTETADTGGDADAAASDDQIADVEPEAPEETADPSTDSLLTASPTEDQGADDSSGESELPVESDDEEESSAETSVADTRLLFDRGPAAVFPKTPPPPRSRGSWRDLVLDQFDPAMIIRLVVRLAGSISQLLSSGILILLAVVFILLEASSLPDKIARAFGSNGGDLSSDAMDRYRTVIRRVRSYIAIKTAISIFTGACIAVWLWLFGVPYAGLWGLLAFLLNYIPNVGSIIAAIPALLIAWLDLGVLPALACGVGFLAVNLVVGNFIEPRMMGRGMGLSPLVVFFSMVFWGWVLGPVGMLVSVPLTMAVRVALEGFDDTRWMGTLLGN